MADNEDAIPLSNPYSWVKTTDDLDDVSLEAFLSKYRPSMVQNDGTKPWIWVTREDGPGRNGELLETLTEAKAVLDATTTRVEEIQNDESIPVRANKKKGTKSKKEVREQVQEEAAAQLKEISIRRKYTNGKWLTFAGSERVDTIWSNLAKSLISGPLSSTVAYCAKVSTSPMEETPNYQHVICIYMPDVYDKDNITMVMKVLLRDHGMNLSGVKSDLYTAIGIKSKHPSGMPSTVFKATDLMKDADIKEMKEAFFEDLKNKPRVAAAEKKAPAAGKAQPKLKKKQNDDPFGTASEDEEDDAPKKKIPVKKAADSDSEDEKPKKAPAKKAPVKKTAAASDSDSEHEKPKKKAPAKKAPIKKAAADSDSEDEKPKKKVPVKKAPAKKAAKDDSDSEDEKPKKAPAKKSPAKKAPAKRPKDDSDDDEDSDDGKSKRTVPAKKRARAASDSDDDDEPAPVRPRRGTKK